MSSAEIFDRGYRKFEGERSGVGGAIRSLSWQTTRSILGLGRKARHKIFPILVIAIAFLPAIIYVGMAALFPADLFGGDEGRPEFWELLGFETSGVAIVLFCAMVVPEALVRDRRDGMFSLYLSTPLSKTSYLASKVFAVMATLMIVTVGPALFFLLALTFEGVGPSGLVNWAQTAGQIFIAGLGISGVLAAPAFAAASITDRRAFASVAAVLVFLGSSIIVDLLLASDFSQDLYVFDIVTMAFEFSARVFGDRSSNLRFMSDTQVFLSCGLWTALSGSVVAYRYRQLRAV